MNETYESTVALSSFRRLYRIVGTALFCVAMNMLLIKLLPAGWEADILQDVSWINSVSTEFFLLWGVLIAPAWETIFQAVPAYLLGKNPSRGRVLVYLCVSALPFAGIHAWGYSNLYAVLLLPVAFVLAYTYYYFYRRNQMAYLMTAIVHGLINLFSYFVLLWSRF